MNIKNKYVSTFMILVIMIVMASAEGFINIFGSSIKSEFALSDSRYSLMFTLGSLAYLIFNFIGGSLCEKIGQKKLFLIGLVGASIANIILASANNFNIFTIGFILIQLFLGMLSIAANTVIPLIWITSQTIIMNLTHFSYGAGLSFSQKLSGVLIDKGISWREIYIFGALFAIITFAIFIFIKIPTSSNRDTKEKDSKINLKDILNKKIIWILTFSLGFYIISEQATGRWLPIYIENKFIDLSQSEIASFISLFFVFLTIGRFFGGFIAEKIGSLKSINIFSLIAAILFVTGLLLGESGLYLISFSGLFFSIIFPTYIIVISDLFKVNVAFITGLIISLAGIVNTTTNLSIGFASDNFGIEKAIFIIPIALTLTFIFSCRVKPSNRE
ncbi:MFS transporter [Clostridium sp.]|uniref:MFS transporter n=1 Tax=Clostridium sp. TaxID=1506 RepID=UPI003F3743A4